MKTEKLFHVVLDELPPLVVPDDVAPLSIEFEVVDFDAVPPLDEAAKGIDIELACLIDVDESAPLLESSAFDTSAMKVQILAKAREICSDCELDGEAHHQTTH